MLFRTSALAQYGINREGNIVEMTAANRIPLETVVTDARIVLLPAGEHRASGINAPAGKKQERVALGFIQAGEDGLPTTRRAVGQSAAAGGISQTIFRE